MPSKVKMVTFDFLHFFVFIWSTYSYGLLCVWLNLGQSDMITRCILHISLGIKSGISNEFSSFELSSLLWSTVERAVNRQPGYRPGDSKSRFIILKTCFDDVDVALMNSESFSKISIFCHFLHFSTS